jgi:hypothetical protein
MCNVSPGHLCGAMHALFLGLDFLCEKSECISLMYLRGLVQTKAVFFLFSLSSGVCVGLHTAFMEATLWSGFAGCRVG